MLALKNGQPTQQCISWWGRTMCSNSKTILASIINVIGRAYVDLRGSSPLCLITFVSQLYI